MALYTSILPCVALVLLPAGGYLVLTGASTLPDYALVLCMSFFRGTASDPSHELYVGAAPAELQD